MDMRSEDKVDWDRVTVLIGRSQVRYSILQVRSTLFGSSIRWALFPVRLEGESKLGVLDKGPPIVDY